MTYHYIPGFLLSNPLLSLAVASFPFRVFVLDESLKRKVAFREITSVCQLLLGLTIKQIKQPQWVWGKQNPLRARKLMSSLQSYLCGKQNEDLLKNSSKKTIFQQNNVLSNSNITNTHNPLSWYSKTHNNKFFSDFFLTLPPCVSASRRRTDSHGNMSGCLCSLV